MEKFGESKITLTYELRKQVLFLISKLDFIVLNEIMLAAVILDHFFHLNYQFTVSRPLLRSSVWCQKNSFEIIVCFQFVSVFQNTFHMQRAFKLNFYGSYFSWFLISNPTGMYDVDV